MPQPRRNEKKAICIGDSYRIGKWEKRKRETNFYTCPWNEHRNCIYEEDQKPRGKNRIEKSMQWDWKPSTCQLHEFNSTKLIAALRYQKRRIFFIGDSLNHDMSVSMECMMMGNIDTITNVDFNETSPTKSLFHDLVPVIRNDLLGCPPKDDPDYGTTKYCSNITAVSKVWEDFVSSSKITERDILVLNTGAHWHGAPEHAATAFSNIANAIALVFNGMVIVRTTVMGHEGCANFDDNPIVNSGVDSVNVSQSKKKVPYNWAQFGTLNDMITNAIEKSSLKNFQILYVDMFELRPDGHYEGVSRSDCLHYCIPGPINWWNKLLYHILYGFLFPHENP